MPETTAEWLWFVGGISGGILCFLAAMRQTRRLQEEVRKMTPEEEAEFMRWYSW
jgi:hypothetical protein